MKRNYFCHSLSKIKQKERKSRIIVDVKLFLHSPIIVLDTCICLSLGYISESAWYEDFRLLRKKGVFFCISDIALTELEVGYLDGIAKKDNWDLMIQRLQSLVSKTFPVIPGGAQLLQLANVHDKIDHFPRFSYVEEYYFSIKQFNDFAKHRIYGKINANSLSEKRALNIRRDRWVLFFDKRIKSDLGSQAPKELTPTRTNINKYAEDLAKSIDTDFYSNPLLSIRAELQLKYLACMVIRTLQHRHSYNPHKSDAINDGIDFNILLPLILPARICTYDKINNIKQIDSFQSNWVLTPKDLVAEFRKRKRIKRLCFPPQQIVR